MKRFWKWTVIVLAGLAALVVLFYAEEDLRGWHAWNQFKHQWEPRGVKLDFAGVVPPPVPDDENFALSPVWVAEIKYLWQNTPKQAQSWYGRRIDDEEVGQIAAQLPVSVSGLVGTNWAARQMPATPEGPGHWMTGGVTDLKPWQSYYRDLQRANPAAGIPIARWPQSPAADVSLALSKFDPVIEKLRQDSGLSASRFPVIYKTDEPFAILLPHLAIVKRYTQVLQLRAVAEVQNGQPDKALADVKLMLRLTDAIRTEPFLISHLVRIAMLNLTLQPVWEGLSQHKWSDAQLAELDVELAKLNFLADYTLGMRSELGAQGGAFDYLRHHPNGIAELSGNGSAAHTALAQRVMWYLIPKGWFYRNRLNCARRMVELYLPLSDTNHGTISPKAAARADAVVRADLKHRNRFTVGEQIFMSGLGNSARRFAYGQELANLARVAVALERFQLAYGEYPGSLNALAPRFITTLPPDVINCQPLSYKASSDGKFVLYSVGWNEMDDGGKVVAAKNGTVDIARGDWVWKN